VDPKTGIANNGAVSVVDLVRNVQTKIIEVGLHPCDMVLSPDKERLYVACANSDIISVINTITDEVVENISVHIQENILFGSSPNDLIISPDGKFFMWQMLKELVRVIRGRTVLDIIHIIISDPFQSSRYPAYMNFRK
jgi:YVTN family beta-propeller protein